MSVLFSAKDGPSDRVPAAAARSPESNSFYVLFEDGTIAMEKEESIDGTGYEMVYRSVQELRKTKLPEYKSDHPLALPDWSIIAVFVAPAILLWLSVRSYVTFYLPQSDSYLWFFLLLTPLLTMLVIKRFVGVSEIIVYLQSEIEGTTLEMVSPTYLSMQISAGTSCLIVVFSWSVSYGSWSPSILGDLVIFIFVSLMVPKKSPLHTRYPFFPGAVRIELLDPKDFFDKSKELIEANIDPLTELLKLNEGSNLEYKASMWTKYKTENKVATGEIDSNQKGKALFLQDEVLHTVAAFLNSAGGILLIGVKDKPLSWGDRPAEVFGVEPDYSHLGKNNQDADGYIQAVYQVLNAGFGNTSTTTSYVKVTIEQYEGKDICKIDVEGLPRIRDAQVYIREKTDKSKEERYYVRTGASSQKMSMESALIHIRDNFPPPNTP